MGLDRTRLVEGVRRQLQVVSDALRSSYPAVPVQGALCFVGADWTLFGGAFAVDGIPVLSPRRLADRLAETGPTDADTVAAVAARLATAFPPA